MFFKGLLLNLVKSKVLDPKEHQPKTMDGSVFKTLNPRNDAWCNRLLWFLLVLAFAGYAPRQPWMFPMGHFKIDLGVWVLWMSGFSYRGVRCVLNS